MIEIQNIEKSFGKQKVLHQINLKLENKGIIAVLGPNGSGKTTLIKTLLGLVKPDKGAVFINEKSILGENLYRRNISYLPQVAHFPDYLTINEFLRFMESLKGAAHRKKELISLFRIEAEMNKNLRKLSGGTLQKVNLVNCFMYDRPIAILDEPTVGLDPVSMISLKDFLKRELEQGKLILITTHMMDFAESLASEIVFLLEGNIYFDGSVQKLFEQTASKTMEEAVACLLEPKKDAHV